MDRAIALSTLNLQCQSKISIPITRSVSHYDNFHYDNFMIAELVQFS